MRNIAFAIWMVGFCACVNYEHYIWFLRGDRYGDAAFLSDAFNIFLWVFIGVCLYEREGTQKEAIKEPQTPDNLLL